MAYNRPVKITMEFLRLFVNALGLPRDLLKGMQAVAEPIHNFVLTVMLPRNPCDMDFDELSRRYMRIAAEQLAFGVRRHGIADGFAQLPLPPLSDGYVFVGRYLDSDTHISVKVAARKLPRRWWQRTRFQMVFEVAWT